MSLLIADYKTLVFDCDGVILNSNRVKTNDFCQVAIPYGETSAEALVNYHIINCGISRYQKFTYFLEAIIPKYAPNLSVPILEQVLEQYAKRTLQDILTCEVASGLKELKDATPNARWLIFSGSDQSEPRRVFTQRGLLELFEAGSYGSLDSKDQILVRKISNSTTQSSGLFLGDSKYDYQASRQQSRTKFCILSEQSEIADWQDWTNEKLIKVKKDIISVLKQQKK